MNVGGIGGTTGDGVNEVFRVFLLDLDEAAACMADGNWRGKDEALDGARRVVDTLLGTLYPPGAPELCRNLTNLYQFIRDQIDAAQRGFDPKPIDDARRIALMLRDAFLAATRQFGGHSIDGFVSDPRRCLRHKTSASPQPLLN